MGTSDETPKKSLAQKGQGMLEYALIMSFVAMVYLIVFADGGFGGAIMDTFDNASETLVMASEKSISGDFGGGGGGGSSGGTLLGSLFSGSSSSGNSGGGSVSSELVDEHHTLEYIASDNYTPLDWHTVINDIGFAYKVVVEGTDPNLSIKSEYNLFSALGIMVNGTREYNYKEEDLKGWNDLMDKMGSQIAENNFNTSYKKTSTGETLDIKRVDDKVVLTYSSGNNKKEFSIYADTQRTMHFKSNTYSDAVAALAEYNTLSKTIRSGDWQFDTNHD